MGGWDEASLARERLRRLLVPDLGLDAGGPEQARRRHRRSDGAPAQLARKRVRLRHRLRCKPYLAPSTANAADRVARHYEQRQLWKETQRNERAEEHAREETARQVAEAEAEQARAVARLATARAAAAAAAEAD